LLNTLGLVHPTEARNNVVHNYELHMRQNILIEFMKLLAEDTFKSVDFGVVREYVSPLAEVTSKELEAAVEIYKKRYPDKLPTLDNLMRYVDSETSASSTVIPRGFAATLIKDQGTVYDFRRVEVFCCFAFELLCGPL